MNVTRGSVSRTTTPVVLRALMQNDEPSSEGPKGLTYTDNKLIRRFLMNYPFKNVWILLEILGCCRVSGIPDRLCDIIDDLKSASAIIMWGVNTQHNDGP